MDAPEIRLRESPRVEVEGRGRIAVGDSEPVEASALDLSARGAGLATRAGGSPGVACDFELELDGEWVRGRGVVVWSRRARPDRGDAPNLGLRFVALEPGSEAAIASVMARHQPPRPGASAASTVPGGGEPVAGKPPSPAVAPPAPAAAAAGAATVASVPAPEERAPADTTPAPSPAPRSPPEPEPTLERPGEIATVGGASGRERRRPSGPAAGLAAAGLLLFGVATYRFVSGRGEGSRTVDGPASGAEVVGEARAGERGPLDDAAAAPPETRPPEAGPGEAAAAGASRPQPPAEVVERPLVSEAVEVGPAAVAPPEVEPPPARGPAAGPAPPEPGAVAAAAAGPGSAPARDDAEAGVPRARRLLGIEPALEPGTETLLLRADAPFRREDIFAALIGPDPPRYLLRLTGIGRPLRPAEIEVGGTLVRRIRTGLHSTPRGPQLHVVLDLETRELDADWELEGDALRLRLRARQP